MSNIHGIGWLNSTGGYAGFKNVNEMPRISATPYYSSIAEGDVSGHTVWAKIGYTLASASTQTTLWYGGTEYVWPSTGMQMQVISTVTTDEAGGTGITSVRIGYLTSTGAEGSEVVSTAGTVAVTTAASNIYRINSFRAASVGTTYKTAGVVSLENTASTPKYSQIGIGMTRARNSVYTVPLAKTLYITSIMFSAAANATGKRVQMTTHATFDDSVSTALGPNFFMPFHEVQLMDNVFFRELEMPAKLIAGTDIKVSVIGEAGAICTSVLRGWLE